MNSIFLKWQLIRTSYATQSPKVRKTKTISNNGSNLIILADWNNEMWIVPTAKNDEWLKIGSSCSTESINKNISKFPSNVVIKFIHWTRLMSDFDNNPKCGKRNARFFHVGLNVIYFIVMSIELNCAHFVLCLADQTEIAYANRKRHCVWSQRKWTWIERKRWGGAGVIYISSTCMTLNFCLGRISFRGCAIDHDRYVARERLTAHHNRSRRPDWCDEHGEER